MMARQPHTTADSDDSGDGALIFWLVVGGALIATAGVTLVALHPYVWVAGFAYAILLGFACAIVAAVLHAMRPRPEPPDSRS